MSYKQFSDLISGDTITYDQFNEIFAGVDYVTVKDDSVRGASSVYRSSVQPGDMVNNGTSFILVTN